VRKRVAILGSTGSIGTQALDVIAAHPERFEVVGLAAGRNEDLLREQARRFGARVATTIADGPEGLLRVAVSSEPDILLAATDGSVAFEAVFAAVERGIDVAVANKELIVAAGALLVESAQRSGAKLLPVDSEHSAIFQCLVGEERESIAAIVLTASGGPFWRTSREAMEHADVEGRARASNVADGNEKHDRFGDDDEQGSGSHRGKPALRLPGRANTHRRSSPIDRARLCSLYRRKRKVAAGRSRYAAADWLRPSLSQPATAGWGPCPSNGRSATSGCAPPTGGASGVPRF
jgi:hypothetical protein